MAKHKADDDEKEEKAHAAKEGVKPTPYPPPPTDQSGEPGANALPPTKKGAAQPPPDEKDAKPPVPTGAEAIAASDAERARLAARVAELERLGNEKGFLLPDDPANVKKTAPVAMATATVTPENGSPVEVEYPADTPKDKRDAAAVAAWKERAGVWDCPTAPHVEHGDAKKPAE
jgi:hypothetical protein